MTDDINARLKETGEQIVKAYERWTSNKKDATTRESLLDAVHELRKVASRLEIELAVSERDEMAERPIPIPPHRAAQPRSHGGDYPDRSRGPARDGASDITPMRRRPPYPGRGESNTGARAPSSGAEE